MPRKSKKSADDLETATPHTDKVDAMNDISKPVTETRTRRKVKGSDVPELKFTPAEEALGPNTPSPEKAKRSRKSPKVLSKEAADKIDAEQMSKVDEVEKSGSAQTKKPRGKIAALSAEVADSATIPAGKKQKTKGDGADEPQPLKRNDSGSERVVIEKSALERYIPQGRTFKVVTWNVTTLRSLVNKNSALLKRLFDTENPDLVCLQETKLNVEDQEEYERKLKELLPGHSFHWNFCTLPDSKSYSGTLAIVRGGPEPATGQKTITSFLKSGKGVGQEAKSVETEDIVSVSMGLPTLTEADGETAKEVISEGRTITVEYEGFYVVASYVPNSGDKLQRLEFRTKIWDRRMGEYLLQLEKKKPVIFCGDLNVAHLDADIWNAGAKHLVKSAGTTPAERQSFSDLLGLGFVDAFRHLNPDAAGWFSYWSVRAGNLPVNRGLRLDYFVTSQVLCPKESEGHKAVVKEVAILSDFVALDHAAVALTLAL